MTEMLARAVTRTFAIDGRRVTVIDDLFDCETVRMLHHYMKSLPFTMSDYDSNDTKHVLHWKFEFDVRATSTLPLIPHFLARVVGATEGQYPDVALALERVYCNNNLYGDIQHPHQDILDGVTALYFANAMWPANWMGETVFYDDSGEPARLVIPKPGRLVIFDGAITHRGGVPSRACFEGRLSVAFKFRPVDPTASR